MTKENLAAVLIDTDATEYNSKLMKTVVHGSLDISLEIEHRYAAASAVDFFVDGWAQGKRSERYSRKVEWSAQEEKDWAYGYNMARQGRLYFSQALHSFYIRLEKERRI